MTHGNRLNGICWAYDAIGGTVVDVYTITGSTCEHSIFVSSISAHDVGIAGN